MPGAQTTAVVIGGGHNGLVAATLLARAGIRTTVLERRDAFGGAAVSERPFPGVDVRLSRYAYLVSLFPRELAADLGIDLRLLRRRISSYTPAGDSGLLIDAEDPNRTASSLHAITGDAKAAAAWRSFYAGTARLARALAPTLLRPLVTRADARARVGDGALWDALIEQPLAHALAAAFPDDLVRGVVLTDALVGTFADPADATLLANRCFLYHVIGNGTGDWDVPVGGMGAVSAALERAARGAGAELRAGSEAIELDTDGVRARVRCADGSEHEADHVLCGAAPAVLDRLLDRPVSEPRPEGSQLKINMVVERLPRLRDSAVDPTEAFAGTFHVNERASQFAAAHAQASAGAIPDVPPLEIYCHSLADPSIVGPDLRARGTQTLTLFAFHMPARCFAGDHDAAKHAAVSRTLASLDAVLAEPIEDCLLRTPDGAPCIEARTPLELEAELALPGGNIFHRDLQWPFADDAEDAGSWGAGTDVANVWLCGAGARRGGGVSGIPGHNAARAVLERAGDRNRRVNGG
jgi:phytoene dehydrogenase-like protein